MTIQKSDLLLLGAGHCHLQLLAELIKLAQHSKSQVKTNSLQEGKPSHKTSKSESNLTQIVLVEKNKSVWYLGLFSAFLYGEIDQDRMEIDLPQLIYLLNRCTKYLNIEFTFIQAEAVSWDFDTKVVKCSNGRELKTKALSLNLGAPIRSIKISKEWAGCIQLGAKPFDTLLSRLIDIPPSTLVVLGGGASGVELILGIQDYLTKMHTQGVWKYSLVVSKGLLQDWPRKSRLKISSLLVERGIEVLEELPSSPSGETPSGVLINATGFYQPKPLRVDNFLRVVNCIKVYGSGDGISVSSLDPVYGGVFPVQQGALLLRILLEDQVLELPVPYKQGFLRKSWTCFQRTKDAQQIVQQTTRLQIINLGRKPYALGRWKGIALHGWVWKKIKNRIDFAFMDQFYLDS